MAISALADATMSELTEFPEWQEKMMTILVQEFGLEVHDGIEHFNIDLEGEEEWQEEMGPTFAEPITMGSRAKAKPKAKAGQRMSGR